MLDDDYEWNDDVVNDKAVVILENCPIWSPSGTMMGIRVNR